MSDLFTSHPPMEESVRRLRALAVTAPWSPTCAPRSPRPIASFRPFRS